MSNRASAGRSGGRGRKLSPEVKAAVDSLAASMGVEPAALRAIVRVEAGGVALQGDGRPTVRFEPKVFFRRNGGATVLLPGMSDVDDGRSRTGGQAAEWLAIATATSLAGQEAAYDASSFGLPQIMGFNASYAGYGSAVAMAEAFRGGVGVQVAAFGSFLRNYNSDLIPALRERRWRDFSRVYNGKPEPHGSNIEAAYREEVARA